MERSLHSPAPHARAGIRVDLLILLSGPQQAGLRRLQVEWLGLHIGRHSAKMRLEEQASFTVLLVTWGGNRRWWRRRERALHLLQGVGRV